MKAFSVRAVLLLLAMSLAATGCQPSQQAARPGEEAAPGIQRPAGERLGITPETYPKVDGSTSAWPLAQYIAGALLGLELCRTAYVGMYPAEPGAKPLLATGVVPRAPDPGEERIPVQAIQAFQQVRHFGTHESYVRLMEAKADFILVARSPSEDELKLAAEKGVDLESKPVAVDAFIFIVNRKNAVDSLTLDQIRRIYTGQITNWSEAGGKDVKVSPYQRERNSGSQELMLSLVMKDLKMIAAPEMIVETMMGPIHKLSADENGLGYSVYYYERFMAPNPQIKVIGVDGVRPNSETIAARQYPLTTEVYAVTRKDLDPASTARKLRDWLLTPQGQKVVAKSGYVPITPPAPS